MTSTIKVNNIQNQCGANIINENSNTITIGASGDTIALASGASQTGFGREGSVNWDTTPKTSTITAASGVGYFVDTSSGGITANLPAGSAGAIVAFADYTRTFGTNALTVTPNGSEKIGGIAASMLLQVDGEAATLVYVDGTEGWINVQQTETSNTGNPFLVASGGTTATCGNCKIHTFTGPGTFTVSQVSSNCASENIVSYLIVGGGGGGGSGCNQSNGGGGAGGYREVKSPITPYTASPLDGYPSSPNRVTVTAQSYAIVVGAGGGGGVNPTGGGAPPTAATQGADSSFGGITGAGGGKGACGGLCYGFAGGSGSGGGQGPFTGTGSYYNGPGCAGAGNTPPVTPSQGNAGGTGYTIYNTPPSNTNIVGGGGGGATAAGTDGSSSLPSVTPGGAGATTNITGSPVAYAGGGGGGSLRQGPLAPSFPVGGAGGVGGGGTGGQCGDGGGAVATAGTANTGGGGGGTGNAPGPGGAAGGGGSGIVVIRYKFK